MTHHFINLFGGLEWEPRLRGTPNLHYCRIQSTACEQKRWDFVIRDLDHTLLLCLAQGHTCHVYDMSAKKPQSRAIYQGLVFVKFVLNRVWFGTEPTCIEVRGQDSTEYFYQQLRTLSPEALSKLKTYRDFAVSDGQGIKLLSRCERATHPDNRQRLKEYLL